jgi:serine protease
MKGNLMQRFRPVHLVGLLLVFLVAITTSAADAGSGRYMVKFRDFHGAANAVRAGGGVPIYEFPGLGVVAARLPAQALQGLRNNPNVEYIEDDPVRELYAQTTPYGIPMVQANQVAFADANAGACKVCIIDSGFYMSHEDLQEANVTVTTDSGSGDPLVDGCGHGSHVAGTIAALGNTTGVTGVIPSGGVALHIVKVFGNDCSWSYSSDLINALNKCKAAGSKVVSMSLGGTFSSRTEQSAFNTAWNEGVLSIAAAGNDGNNRKSYPASYSSVVSVAAIDANKNVATFSQFNSEVDIAAPGVGILSTVPWKGASLTVGTSKYLASGITGSAESEGVSGALAGGGLCDSSGSWSGKVVLCERGGISFRDKVNNVLAGGGAAAVIYNNVSGGFAGTCDDGTGTTCDGIPAISISQEDGQALVSASLGATGTIVNSTTPGSGYEAWDGTSMATPHVSGVAALVWSNFPARSNADIRNALEQTAQDLGAAGRDNYYGHGLVQAKAAYDLLAGGSSCTPATEVCGDGIDNDCDGQVDEGCSTTCPDADGDGWTTCDGDCDDSSNKVYPGANDTKGKAGRDGIDNDCDGTPDA